MLQVHMAPNPLYKTDILPPFDILKDPSPQLYSASAAAHFLLPQPCSLLALSCIKQAHSYLRAFACEISISEML